jgi:hypothetical protein
MSVRVRQANRVLKKLERQLLWPGVGRSAKAEPLKKPLPLLAITRLLGMPFSGAPNAKVTATFLQVQRTDELLLEAITALANRHEGHGVATSVAS